MAYLCCCISVLLHVCPWYCQSRTCASASCFMVVSLAVSAISFMISPTGAVFVPRREFQESASHLTDHGPLGLSRQPAILAFVRFIMVLHVWT